MVITVVPIVMAVGGALIYALASPQSPKAAEIGRAIMWAGLIAFALANAGKVVSL